MFGIINFSKKKGDLILSCLSFFLTMNSLFFIALKMKEASDIASTNTANIFYFLYFILSVLTLGTIVFFSEKFSFKEAAKKVLLVYLPTEIILLFGTERLHNFHYFFAIATKIYAISAGIYLIGIRKFTFRENFPSKPPNSEENRILNKKWLVGMIILTVMAVNFFFGFYHLSKFAAVDEALWTYDRIPEFWKEIGKRNWSGTQICDKPGITVAIISGTGLIWENPKKYKLITVNEGYAYPLDKNIEKLNFAFRFPLFLFTVLCLPFFYFFLKKPLGKLPALFSLIFIGLSPLLIGISTIINPDSILWIFAPLAIFAYFSYLKTRDKKQLYFSGIFLGLAILTKYVANILYIFFFGLIFLEYIFNARKYSQISATRYLKESFIDYIILIFISLSTFCLLFPGTWLKTERLLNGTIYSQAFKSIWPVFAFIVLFILVDRLIYRGRITSRFLLFFARRKKIIFILLNVIFLAFILAVCANVFSQMKFFDFENILSSPKTAYREEGFIGMMLANFYPLIFGISPLALVLLVFLAIKNIINGDPEKTSPRISFYLIFFILLYYLGSTVNQVADTARYQIMLFPIALAIAGISAGETLQYFKKKKVLAISSILAFLMLVNSLSFYYSAPFYISYSSELLPKKYYIDLKDMGTGSYEAAEFLNSLHDAENLKIWTDKRGVCNFFHGKCFSGFDFSRMKEVNFDYVVVSAGRESRTTKIMEGLTKGRKNNNKNIDSTKYFDQYYTLQEEPVFQLFINGRPGQYVKVFNTTDAGSI